MGERKTILIFSSEHIKVNTCGIPHQIFVSLGAGTRAGKGAAIGIPNLLVRKHSLIALDPKQELWKITSKVREILLGNKVYLLDPFNSKTHQFNPLFLY